MRNSGNSVGDLHGNPCPPLVESAVFLVPIPFIVLAQIAMGCSGFLSASFWAVSIAPAQACKSFSFSNLRTFQPWIEELISLENEISITEQQKFDILSRMQKFVTVLTSEFPE